MRVVLGDHLFKVTGQTDDNNFRSYFICCMIICEKDYFCHTSIDSIQ
jgi:hypothetical protein